MGERNEYGSGSLYKKQTYILNRRTGEKTPHEYWQAARVVRLEDGTSTRVTGTSQVSKRLAQDALDKNIAKFYRREVGDEQPIKKPARNRLTLGTYLDQWHAGLYDREISDIVLRKYKGFYSQHVSPYLGDIALEDLNDDQLKELFYKTLVEKKKIVDGKASTTSLLGSSARRNVYKCLNTALKAAVEKRLIPSNPLALVKAPRMERPEENVPQMAHIAVALLERMNKDNHVDYCRFLMQFLGLRRAERLGITLSNVKDLNGKEPKIIINQQLARHDDGSGWYIKNKTKTGKTRTIPIPEPFLGALKSYKKQRDQWVKSPDWDPKPEFKDVLFLQSNGALINANRDNTDWTAVLKQYDYPYWRAHLNRHITATLLADQGTADIAVVQALIGNSEAMTMYYSRLTNKRMKEPLQTFGQNAFSSLMQQQAEEKD
jgi:integrase